MRFYELLYIARSDLTSTQIDNLNNNITSIIESANKDNKSNQADKVNKIESWGVKTLAYKSKKLKRNKGNFCLIHFTINNFDSLKELQNRLKLNESVLRFVIKQVNNTKTTSTSPEKSQKSEALAS